MKKTRDLWLYSLIYYNCFLCLRYTQVARQLVLMARGDNTGRGWKMKNGQEASFDDICVFVIPLYRCLDAVFKK